MKRKQSMQILTFASFQSQSFWIKYKEFYSDIVINLVNQKLYNFKKLINYKDVGSPYTFYRYTNNRSGSAFGLAQNLKQMKPNFLPTSTSINNFYIVGHWTNGSSSPSGIPGVAVSGRKAAELICDKFDKLWKYPILRT